MSRPSRIVLLYHRVTHVEHDPFGLVVEPGRFVEQCEVLRRHFEAVPISDESRGRRQVAITFDDGYADNAAEARDVLLDASLPATFFITSGRIDDPTEMWSDRLEQLLLGRQTGVRNVELEIAGRRLWADIRSRAARQRAHLAFYWRLRPLQPARIRPLLDELELQLGVRALDRDSHRWMNVDELRRLASTDGFDIGAHTVTHPFLASLAVAEQREEIVGGRRRLEAMLGAPVRTFSYPYGSRDAFDTVTTRLVRDAGYELACTATGGPAAPDGDRFRIPRNVVGNWDGPTFENWLDRWFDLP